MTQTTLNFMPISGQHCESTAILNALNFQKYHIKETQILGAGTAPSFIFEKSRFPFLGGRCYRMRDYFLQRTQIPFKIITKTTKATWNEIEELINNRIPIVLRVDMRYLPYLFNGKYGPHYMSFGWHYITLFDIDKVEKIALVTDTTCIGYQKIKISDLFKARFSKTKVYPPNGEYYYFLKGEFSISNWEEIAQLSLVQYFKNMNHKAEKDNQLTGLLGLKLMGQEILKMNRTVSPFLLSAVMDFHYGCIETNGTGGAAFRTMYYQFMEEHLCSNRDCILPAFEKCEQAWHSLANSYKKGALTYRKGSSKQKKDVLSFISAQYEQVYRDELVLNQLIRDLYRVNI